MRTDGDSKENCEDRLGGRYLQLCRVPAARLRANVRPPISASIRYRSNMEQISQQVEDTYRHAGTVTISGAGIEKRSPNDCLEL